MKSWKRRFKRHISIALAMIFFLMGIFEYAIPVQALSSLGTITVAVERFTIGQGYLIEPYIMEIQEGDTYEDICRRVLEENGYKYDAKDAGFYLQGIHGADLGTIKVPSCIGTIGSQTTAGGVTVSPPNNSAVNEYAGDTAWLGEFSYSSMSGWMYSVGNDNGNVFPGVGMGGYVPNDGDVFRLQFSVYGYGTDLQGMDNTGKQYYTVGDKTALTRKIAQINQDKEKWFSIEGCQDAYNNAIRQLQKVQVTQKDLDNALAKLPEEEPILPESVTLKDAVLDMTVGDNVRMIAQVAPDNVNQLELIWSSSDDQVAAVDQNGYVTAKSPGEADIQVMTQNGKSTSCHVKVSDRAIEKIILNMTSASMEEGESFQLQVKSYEPENATETLEVTYKSSDDTIASVDESGTVTAGRPGKAVITLKTMGGVTASCEILVGNASELAEAMEVKIAGLPEAGKVTEENADKVMAVWEEYSSLSEKAKSYISKDYTDRLAEVKAEAEKILETMENISAVNKMLAALPGLSEAGLSNEDGIEAARAAYDTLSIEEQGKVDTDLYAKLLNLERRISELWKEISAVRESVLKIPENVTLGDAEETVSVWAEYAALSEEQKAQIGEETVNRLNQSIDSAIGSITQAVEDTDITQAFDLSSQMVQDFLIASNACEKMDDALAEKLPEETLAALEQIREWIGRNVHISGNISVSASWFIQIVTKDEDMEDSVVKALERKYSTLATVVLNKNISYIDIRSGEVYEPEKNMLLTVDLSAFENLNHPAVATVTVSDSGKVTLKELDSQNTDNGMTFKTKHVGTLLIADNPIKVTGISVPKSASVGIGKTITLSVEYAPSNATINKEVKYKSSDASVVQVDKNGKIKGIAPGTAVVTVSLKTDTSVKAKCKVTVTDKANELEKSVSKVMKETRSYMLSIDTNPTIGSEWFVLGLARSGKNLKDDYFTTYYNHVANYLKEKDGKLTNTALYTEYSKMILIMTSIGKDARNVAGYNLFSYIADFDKVKKQGFNGPIWALIALNCKEEYSFPKVSGVKNPTTEKKLIKYLLDGECSGGGWSLMGDKADPDITGMTLQALAPYYNKSGYEDVTKAIDRAVNKLSAMQNDTGGFSTMNVETSESCAQVLTGLCAVGIDPKTDARFIKNGHWIVENLISYHIDGSGFMHVKAGADNNGGGEAGKVNGMATEQGYYALTAYWRFTQEKTSLYDMSDLTVKAGGSGDNSGTGLEEENNTGNNNGSDKGTNSGDNNSNKTASQSNTSPSGSASGRGVSAGGTSKSASSASGTSKKATSSSKTATDKKKTETEEEEESGWSFEGEDYKPDTAQAQPEDSQDKGASASGQKTVMQKVFAKENTPYFLCIGCGLVLLFLCIWMKKKNKET